MALVNLSVSANLSLTLFYSIFCFVIDSDPSIMLRASWFNCVCLVLLVSSSAGFSHVRGDFFINSTWPGTSAVSPPWAGKTLFSMTTHLNRVLLLGGEVQGTCESSGDIFSSVDFGQTWSPYLVGYFAPIHSAGFISFQPLGGVQPYLVIIGGVRSCLGHLTDVWTTDNPGRVWDTTPTSIANTIGPRSSFGLVQLVRPDGVPILVLWGGHNNVAAKNDVWSSLDGKQWTLELASAPWAARAHFAFASFRAGTSLIMSGGTSAYTPGGSQTKSDIWSTSADKLNVWMRLAAAPAWSTGREFSRMVNVGGNLITAGGADNTTKYYNDVWISSDDARTWKQITAADAFPKRSGYGFAVVGQALVLVGGKAGQTVFNDAWNAHVYMYPLISNYSSIA